MVNKDHFYRTFGELLYVVAMSDGVIQPEETDALDAILKEHPRGEEIQWSFDYEKNHNNGDIESLYKKVVAIFSDAGPNEEYDFMISSLKKLAVASDGIDVQEAKVITNFSKDLLDRFIKDLAKEQE